MIVSYLIEYSKNSSSSIGSIFMSLSLTVEEVELGTVAIVENQ